MSSPRPHYVAPTISWMTPLSVEPFKAKKLRKTQTEASHANPPSPVNSTNIRFVKSKIQSHLPSTTSPDAHSMSIGSPSCRPASLQTIDFVDVQDANSKLRIQKHSMQHYVRQKRQKQIERLCPSDVPKRLQWQRKDAEVHISGDDARVVKKRKLTPSAGSVNVKRGACIPSMAAEYTSLRSSPSLVVDSNSSTTPDHARYENEVSLRAAAKVEMPDKGDEAIDEALYDQHVDVSQSSAGSKSSCLVTAGPVRWLGSGKWNPFDTAPIMCSGFEDQMLDYYVNSRCSRGTHASFFQHLVADAMHDKASFHLVLSYAAHHSTALRDLLGLPALRHHQAMEHKVAGLRLINEQISNPYKATSDRNVQAALFMLAIENVFGSEKATLIHLDGLRKMIFKRGGFRAFSDNPFLELQICWVELAGSASMAMDCVPYCDDSPSALVNSQSQTAMAVLTPALTFCGADIFAQPELDDLSAYCDKLTLSLQNFQLLGMYRQACDLKSYSGKDLPSRERAAFEAATCKSVAAAFGPGSAAQQLLSCQVRPSSIGFPSTQDSCRLASLLYIHATLWDFRNSRRETEKFVADVLPALDADRLHDGHGSVEALLWILIGRKQVDRLDSPARTHSVLQMITAARRLGQSSWTTLENILTQSLLGNGYGDGDIFGFSWDSNALRAEILASAGPFGSAYASAGNNTLVTPVSTRHSSEVSD